MNQYNIFPLFASNFLVIEVNRDLDSNIQDLKKEKFYSTNQQGSKNSQSSVNMQVLEKVPILKKNILEEFNKYANEILCVDCEFEISKSWITKIEKNSFSQKHVHKNSFYSGVFYFDEYANNSGQLELYTPLLYHSDFLITPVNDNYTIHNSLTWKYSPQKNTLVFFPSYIEHRISENLQKSPRYSLAFNIVPTGRYGKGDSEIHANWEIS